MMKNFKLETLEIEIKLSKWMFVSKVNLSQVDSIEIM